MQFSQSLLDMRKVGIIRKANIGLMIINFIFQRIFLINFKFPLMIHFTSKLTSVSGLLLTGKPGRLDLCLAVNGGINIQASNGVVIDRSSLIAPGVKIFSGNHNQADLSEVSLPDKEIVINKNCWLGANSIILPGVTLEEGTIVGAGAVVTKSFFKKNIVIAGNPARVIRNHH